MKKQVFLTSILLSIIALGLLNPSEADGSEKPFQEWKSKHAGDWSKGEEPYRRIIFNQKLQEIQQHNADPTQTYQKGLNQFSALTEA